MQDQFVIGFTAPFLIITLAAIVAEIQMGLENRRFEKLFGFRPFEKGDRREKLDNVETRLRELGKELSDQTLAACTAVVPDNYKPQLNEINTRFHKTYKAAYAAGFNMRSSSLDYLPTC